MYFWNIEDWLERNEFYIKEFDMNLSYEIYVVLGKIILMNFFVVVFLYIKENLYIKLSRV